MFITFFKELYQFRLVLKQLIWQQLTMRYRRTALGFFWTLLNPLLTMVVTAVVFSMIMRWPLKTFAIFLFSGLVPYTLFSNCLSQGMQALLNNESLIKKIHIPKQIFVVSVSISLLVDAVFSTICLFIIALAIGAPFTASLFILPINFLLLFGFAVGLALMLSIATVSFRDLPNIVSVLLQALYYLTPIIYPMSFVPDTYKFWLELNPLTLFVEIFRLPLYEGGMASLEVYGKVALMAVISMILGIYVFKKHDRYVVFKL
ncbi:ABC transporter permease [Pseudomonas fluorescens]|uniref:Transport permease protein n=1 Tax=Pseudomonas fluorescens TaxID=294 RepID=A0A5E6UBQ6_PSEFL|nr:ABC transporter permease [Pseudomonas fluorescens]VVN02992.1 Polysialic acid transport protein KpsM [Pseudomonas fluorescens]